MGFFDKIIDPRKSFGALFPNPADKANKYLDKIPSTIKPYYDPYIDSGKRQIPGLEDAYGDMMGDPSAMLKKWGEGYQKSPGFDFALKQALGASGNAAAAGGMAGTPQHEMENMSIATDLGNQDFNNYLQNAMSVYNRGLSGSERMMEGGRSSADALARMLSENLGQKGSYSAAGQEWMNNLLMGLMGTGARAMM